MPLVSVLLKQDANWDLKNYHLANAWAWLHDRYGQDLAPAGMQSFFNPLPDIPYYLLAMGPLAHWPRVLAALMGLPYGAIIFVTGSITLQLARSQARRPDALDVAGLIIGCTGAALVSQVGTTFNEVPLALLILVSFALLMHAASAETLARHKHSMLIAGAGVLAGLAAGLKPTEVVYLPAIGLAWLAASPSQRRCQGAALLTLAGALGFALTYGAWGWHLWHLTGNPIFPMFNGLFGSDWTAASAGTDPRFMPRSTGQWLVYPFYWAFHHGQVVTEAGMSDPRLALASLALLALGVSHLLRRRTAHRSRASRLVWVFALTAYLGWLALFSIYRYIIPVEVLSGLGVAAGVRLLLSTTGRLDRRPMAHYRRDYRPVGGGRLHPLSPLGADGLHPPRVQGACAACAAS